MNASTSGTISSDHKHSARDCVHTFHELNREKTATVTARRPNRWMYPKFLRACNVLELFDFFLLGFAIFCSVCAL